jgi:hypothetical protein
MIISASRRCDLPAFGMVPFLAALREGHVDVRNPFDARRTRRVSLAPLDVDCLVFWTRDPRPLLEGLDELGELSARFIVQLTITGYPRALEPRVAPTGAVLDALGELARRIGPARLVWRYDPVILGGGLDRGFHEANFARLAAATEGLVSRATLSLVDEYAYTRKRLLAAGVADPIFGSPRKPAPLAARRAERGLPPEPWPGLLASLAAIAATHGHRLTACAEPWDLESLGILREACIDGPYLETLFGRKLALGKDPGQRPGCSCAPSVDIGEYGACPAGCVYCYAKK